jgi:hypothetical protein
VSIGIEDKIEMRTMRMKLSIECNCASIFLLRCFVMLEYIVNSGPELSVYLDPGSQPRAVSAGFGTASNHTWIVRFVKDQR